MLIFERGFFSKTQKLYQRTRISEPKCKTNQLISPMKRPPAAPLKISPDNWDRWFSYCGWPLVTAESSNDTSTSSSSNAKPLNDNEIRKSWWFKAIFILKTLGSDLILISAAYVLVSFEKQHVFEKEWFIVFEMQLLYNAVLNNKLIVLQGIHQFKSRLP